MTEALQKRIATLNKIQRELVTANAGPLVPIILNVVCPEVVDGEGVTGVVQDAMRRVGFPYPKVLELPTNEQIAEGTVDRRVTFDLNPSSNNKYEMRTKFVTTNESGMVEHLMSIIVFEPDITGPEEETDSYIKGATTEEILHVMRFSTSLYKNLSSKHKAIFTPAAPHSFDKNALLQYWGSSYKEYITSFAVHIHQLAKNLVASESVGRIKTVVDVPPYFHNELRAAITEAVDKNVRIDSIHVTPMFVEDEHGSYLKRIAYDVVVGDRVLVHNEILKLE